MKLHQMYRRFVEEQKRKYSKNHLIDLPESTRVLVVSPHPDDDVFGCGGTIIKHIQRGDSVNTVYLCKGGKGIKNKPRKDIEQIREKEARKACSVMGLKESNIIFLNNRDGSIGLSKKNVEAFNEVLKLVDPDIVYAPSFLDNHRDHYYANKLLRKSILQENCLVSGFEIWTPHIPNRLVDISQQIDQKIEAIKTHESQIAELDYLNGILGLNSYRACFYPNKRISYAEAFIHLKAWEYFKLFS